MYAGFNCIYCGSIRKPSSRARDAHEDVITMNYRNRDSNKILIGKHLPKELPRQSKKL